MSARAERRRLERAQRRTHHAPDPDADYLTIAGWFQSLDDLKEAKRLSHDNVVDALGDRRTGPVQWRYATGPDAHRLLDQVAAGPKSDELGDHYRRLRAHLREWGGYIIVAMARGRR